MKVSKSFLNDYINIKDKDFKEIADKMVFLGNEYDSFTMISSATDLVVGNVLERKDHPSSDKLNVCVVDIGDNVNYQIVCGAPNVDSGQKVIVAKVGSKLPGNITIQKSIIRGMESNGMICSLAELGLEKKFLTQEDYDGIYVLNNDAKIGEDAILYLGYDDEIIDFSLTSNRSDLLSMIGMAYEVGALYNLDVKYPETKVDEKGENITVNHKLTVETKNCDNLILKRVNNVKIEESPAYIKNRLIASGIRPINNVVDISNYVMLETGQPIHFYDADKLGNKLSVRMATNNEEVVTIDKKTRILSEEDIVITDGSKVVGLAGVMGGFDTEVTSETTNVIIECAIFNPKNIRNTARRILRSEASARFEKGINPEMTKLAIERSSYLLNKYAGGEVTPGTLVHDTKKVNNTVIDITLEKINLILAMNLTVEEVSEVFNKLKFDFKVTNEKFTVTIPSRRMDLTIAEDLLEEIGRIVGYDRVIGVLPITSIKKGTISPKLKLDKAIRNRLEGLGLKQVLTYSLISKKECELFVNKPKELVMLKDPLSLDKSIMRNSLIPSLLSVYNYNADRNIKDVNIFEIGSRYYKEDEVYKEVNTLSGLLSGTYIENTWQNNTVEVDFYLVKGIIENLFKYLGLNTRYSFETGTLKDMHPGRSAIIKVGLEEVGFLGAVHPSLSDKTVYVFELNLAKILNLNIRNPKFIELTKYPSITKDVAFIADKQLSSQDIVNAINTSGKPLLTDIDVFDVYEGDNLEANQKSLAYTLTFSDPMRTLTDEEVTIVFEKIINDVTKKLYVILRDK